MTSPREEMDRYLAIRRRLGFALERHGVLLADFVAHLEVVGASHLTVEVAMSWATSPVGVHPVQWRQRLGIVRSFARHLKTVDPRTEVPPNDLLRARRERITPYLYSDDDIAGLMKAARALRPEWRAVTFEVLIGLLAVTGMFSRGPVSKGRPGLDISAGRRRLVARR